MKITQAQIDQAIDQVARKMAQARADSVRQMESDLLTEGIADIDDISDMVAAFEMGSERQQREVLAYVRAIIPKVLTGELSGDRFEYGFND